MADTTNGGKDDPPKHICFSFQTLFNTNWTTFCSHQTRSAFLASTLPGIPLRELTALPRPLPGFKGPLYGKGKEGKKGLKKGKARKKGKKGKEKEGIIHPPPQNKFLVTALIGTSYLAQ